MTSRNVSSYLPNLLGPVDFEVGGVATSVPRRGTINLIGATVEDDPDNERTDINLAVGTFVAPTGTGFVTVTGGVLQSASIKVNLASTTYVTGILPVANGGTGVTSLTLPASGLVVGTTDSQTLTGKTISGASNTLTVRLASDVTGTLPGANMAAATTGAAGSMSAADKTKLDGIQKQGLSHALATGYDIDWSLAGVYTKTLGAGAQSITFSNATDGQCIVAILTGSATTLTWPTVKWAGGTPPTQTASGTDVYTFVKAGSTIYGSVVQAMA